MKKLTSLCIAVVLLTLPVVVFAGGHVKHTDFIEGKVKLEKCPKRHGSFCYFSPGMDLAKFNRVAFSPIEYRLHRHSDYRGVDPDDFRLVSQTFHQTLVEQLEPDYPVVEKVNAQTLAVRIALVDIKLKKRSRTLAGWTPIGLVVGTAQDKVTKKLKMLDAVIEAELLDGGTGERLAVLVDQILYEDGSNTESWESMKLILKHYAQRIKFRLDEAHAK